MRAAVIGGGVFGCTIAVDLARAGWSVDLYEARGDILDGATARNQARLHSGYHYPRSDATALAAKRAAPIFADRFPMAVRSSAVHHYVIADDSRVSADEYLAFLDRVALPYEVVEPPHVHDAQLTVRVPEAFVSISTLRRLLRRELAGAGVMTHLNRWAEPPMAGYDLTVVATYGQPWARPLRYEVCELALLDLGRYGDSSYVVLDGEYVSLDPHGTRHALYDVAHSVHAAAVGYKPFIPDAYLDLLWAAGPRTTPLSNVDWMRKTASRHLYGLEPHGMGVSIYAGSLFSVRAVLPDVDETDERPTLVERDGNVISVLSGKICTSTTAAREVVACASA